MVHDYEVRRDESASGRGGWVVGYAEKENWYNVSKTFADKSEAMAFLKVMQAYAERKKKQEKYQNSKKRYKVWR